MRHLERHHYSGPASRAFWRRIWGLRAATSQRRLYDMAGTLQAKEERLLRELRKAEEEQKPCPKKGQYEQG